MKKLVFASAILLAFGFSACKKGGCDTNDIKAATEKITAAATDYANDSSSTAKCNAYKAAYQAYIDEFKDCDSITKADLDAAQAAIDGLTCP